jgi:hypothetical protein
MNMDEDEWDALTEEQRRAICYPAHEREYEIHVVSEYYPEYTVEYDAGELEIETCDVLVRPFSDIDEDYTVLHHDNLRSEERDGKWVKRGRLFIARNSFMESPGTGRRHFEEVQAEKEEDKKGEVPG